MGLLSDIKKLLFANKAVAKSAVEKAKDYSIDKVNDIVDGSQEGVENIAKKIGTKTSGLRDSILENTEGTLDSIKNKASDISKDLSENEMVKKAGDLAENIGDTVLSAGEEVYKKSGEIGDKILDSGEKVWEKSTQMADDLLDKAKKVSEDMSTKLDETIEKAEAWKESEANKPEFSETPINLDDSLLDGTDDFFSKAEKYAEGDFGAFSEGKITVQKEKIEVSKEPVKAAGFEDLDGDGNEIIDDAIVLGEEE